MKKNNMAILAKIFLNWLKVCNYTVMINWPRLFIFNLWMSSLYDIMKVLITIIYVASMLILFYYYY